MSYKKLKQSRFLSSGMAANKSPSHGSRNKEVPDSDGAYRNVRQGRSEWDIMPKFDPNEIFQ